VDEEKKQGQSSHQGQSQGGKGHQVQATTIDGGAGEVQKALDNGWEKHADLEEEMWKERIEEFQEKEQKVDRVLTEGSCEDFGEVDVAMLGVYANGRKT
jgi:hypothetical protein